MERVFPAKKSSSIAEAGEIGNVKRRQRKEGVV